VENLFYNVPARLKFLKHDLTERRAIDALVTRYALAYPGVRFSLLDNGTASLQTAGDGDRRAILASMYGVDIARQMLEVQSDDEDFSLGGFISPVGVTRSNRKEITFFVNGRWVQDTPLNAALLQAYHTLLMVGRYPLAILFLELPAGEVDVNVHPAKAEVRFRSPDKVFSFVQRSIRRALLAYTPAPQAALQNLWHTPGFGGRSVDPAWDLAGAESPIDAGSQPPASDGDIIGGSMQPGSTQPGGLPVPLLRLVG
jgi:DNA mismatch repair protein MutL